MDANPLGFIIAFYNQSKKEDILHTNEIVLNQFNDEEALALLSGLGFRYEDWPFIKKVGVKKILNSDLLLSIINDKANKIKNLTLKIKSMRHFFDRFYANHGYLISPLSNPSSKLFSYPCSPLVFFGQLNKNLIEQNPMVAIVGSRLASREAIAKTLSLAKVLAQYGILIVSGGAVGIDQAAHEGALAYGGSTIKILGSTCLGHKMPNNPDLCIIFPYGPLTPQGKFMFVERNRYVVSLAKAVVIMEGKKGSGTLHTARFAKDLNIPIYVLPGKESDPLSYVPNYLLGQQKAKPLTDFADLVREIGDLKQNIKQRSEYSKMKSALPKNLPFLLQLLHDHENRLTLDEIIAITNMPLLELQKALLDFELEGRIVREGAQFVLTGT
jgi:DNA processing protein